MKEIKTEIIIHAPREKVWEILTNFEHYKSWNPFIISIEGEKKEGSTLRNTLLSQGKETVFKPVIKRFEANQHFEWLGSLPLGLFTGRHYFSLEELGPKETKLIHGEVFGGILRKFIMNKIGEETYQSFLAMNRALKQEAES